MALNRISALIGIFFGNALRYIYFGCLSSAGRSITKIKEEFRDIFEFLKKGTNYACTEGWTYALVSGKPRTPIPGECRALAGDFSGF